MDFLAVCNIIYRMKQLSDSDLEKMLGAEFVPDDKTVQRNVRSQLHLNTLIPKQSEPLPKHVVLDLHGKTEEQAWAEINELIHSGIRSATIITGASGILKTKFKDWITNGILEKYMFSRLL